MNVAGNHWGDAIEAAQCLSTTDRRTLLWLLRLPLLPVRVLQQVAGLAGGSSVYRRVDRLHADGLVGAVRPAMGPCQSPQLHYLTDLGLATLAVDQDVEMEHLARHSHVRQRDLVGRLMHVAHLIRTYELLGALAASRPGRPELLEWACPWRMRFQRPTAKAPTSLSLPASAVLSWAANEGSEGRGLVRCGVGHETAKSAQTVQAACILVPDLAERSLNSYRVQLARLLAFRRVQRRELPCLVIATTTDERARAWAALVEEISRSHHDAPPPVRIATWGRLAQGLELSVVDNLPAMGATPTLDGCLPRLVPRRPTSRLPRLVGRSLSARPSVPIQRQPDNGPAHWLSPQHDTLLLLVGQHAFLTLRDISVVMGWTQSWTRRRVDHLERRGFVRRLTVDGVGGEAGAPGLLELTRGGLEEVAARRQSALEVAVHEYGLSGGGPMDPMGPRRDLVRKLEHTRGVNAVFAALCKSIRKLNAAAGDCALVEWRNEATCSSFPIHPDGYFILRHGSADRGFFLEYDRGTMYYRDLIEKFGAYAVYRTGERCARAYDGFPTVLVVTTRPVVEERIAKAARAVRDQAPPLLPVLITTTDRIQSDPRGLVGNVWRKPEGEPGDRRYSLFPSTPVHRSQLATVQREHNPWTIDTLGREDSTDATRL